MEEPPTKVSKFEMESQYLEGDVMDEGQEEWLSEEVFTDDDYNNPASQQTIGDQSGSNVADSHDETLASASADDSQMETQQNNQQIVIQQIDGQPSGNQHIVIHQVDSQNIDNKHNIVFQGLSSEHIVFEGLDSQQYVIQQTDGSQQIVIQQINNQQMDGQQFVIQQVGGQQLDSSQIDTTDSNIEETLNNFENAQKDNQAEESDLPAELSTFLTRKTKPGRAASDEQKDGEDDGNDTDDLLRVLGDGDQKDKIRIKKKEKHDADSTDEDDSFIFEKKKAKSYQAAKNAIRRAAATKALPEDDITDCSSDEASKPSQPSNTVNKKNTPPKEVIRGLTISSTDKPGLLTVTPPTLRKKVVRRFVEVHVPKTAKPVVKKAPSTKQYTNKHQPQAASVLKANPPKLVEVKKEIKLSPKPTEKERFIDEKVVDTKEKPNPRSSEIKKPEQQIKKQEQHIMKPEQHIMKQEQHIMKPEQLIMKQEQHIMKPEMMDEEVPTDGDSDEDDDCYDELPSSESEDQNDWFTLDIRAERAGDYLPLLGEKAYEILLEEKQRVAKKLETLKHSFRVLTDEGREQAEKLRIATHTAAELDAMLRAT